MEVKVLIHSSIKLSGSKIIYFDPFKIDKEYKDADIIFISHDHYDHFSKEDIKKIIKEDTVIVVPNSLKEEVKEFNIEFLIVEPDKNYEIKDISFETIRAYNIAKAFHPYENNWVGYNVLIDGYRYYVAGDSDNTKDAQKVKCDIALVPIGSKYTMDYKEAADLINIIKPSKVIPTHYNDIIGTSLDAAKFKELVDSNIEVEIQL